MICCHGWVKCARTEYECSQLQFGASHTHTYMWWHVCSDLCVIGTEWLIKLSALHQIVSGMAELFGWGGKKTWTHNWCVFWDMSLLFVDHVILICLIEKQTNELWIIDMWRVTWDRLQSIHCWWKVDGTKTSGQPSCIVQSRSCIHTRSLQKTSTSTCDYPVARKLSNHVVYMTESGSTSTMVYIS